MARPTLRIGIQPQTTMWAVVLGGVCYYQWYTERYSRDEEALEEHIKKTYLRNAQEAQAKMPQLAATIRGQNTSLDGNMDKLVWGGKAKLKHNKGGNSGNGTEAGLAMAETDESEEDGTITSSNNNNEEEPKTTRKRKKKKRRKDKRTEEERRTKELEEQQKSLVLKSSIAGVAVGAVAVAAVSVFVGGAGGGTSGRK